MSIFAKRAIPWATALAGLTWVAPTAAQTGQPPRLTVTNNPLAGFDLPDSWEERFWADPGVKALVALDAKAVADLVPVQAGLRWCRCPACFASETDDTLSWSLLAPEELTCRSCGAVVPNDKVPAKVDGKVPEDVIEVRPHVLHKYSYHLVPPERQAYPDERLYLAAKRDDRIRELLAKAALYAAVRAHERPTESASPALARLACVILLRFAQVYPAYATHYDQPGEPKFFDRADLPPPYRRGYRTARWDVSASVGVPLNLVIAYSLVRESPALYEAGAALGDPRPARTIEHDFFRAAATFVRNQPEEFSEASLSVYRGLLAVGRVLGDPDLVHDAVSRLDGLAERGFYHDGLWRTGDAAAQKRIVVMVDGWLDRLLAGYTDPPGYNPASGRRFAGLPGAGAVPILALARVAEAAPIGDPHTNDIQQVAWPAPRPTLRGLSRRPILLGGAGLARLAVGEGAGALDLEVRGLGDLGGLARSNRLALRLAVGGRPILGDLDDQPPLADGWDRATPSHNTVAVDGLNQRETTEQARHQAPGADVLFFAADADFQVIWLADRYAYPRSTTRYRQVVVAARSGGVTYAASVFEVEGGLQHDQFFHAAAGVPGRWKVSVPTVKRSSSLLPPAIVFVPNARAEDGRWFVHAYGEFGQLVQGRADRPTQAVLETGPATGIRLHLLGDPPATLLAGISPDPSAPIPRESGDERGRAALIVRRRAETGATLRSHLVTVFEPIVPGGPGIRVGRVASEPGTVLILVRTSAGDEHVFLNLEPGTERTVRLSDGRALKTDGFAVRVAGSGLQLAGGTYAELGELRVGHPRAAGAIVRSGREHAADSRGWFETAGSLPTPQRLAGRTLLIRHEDGTSHAWTVIRVENLGPARARIAVREEPGFRIDPKTGAAQAYQFPRGSFPGPHEFVINQISR